MEIGIIGLGDMGRLYARQFSKRGYTVNGCGSPGKMEQLKRELPGINVLPDGIAVSRRSDLIIYSVQAEKIEKVVKHCGPSTKKGAIVGGQTSVKTPEIKAFERYLPEDANIVTCHSLHGPTVAPDGQTLAVIRHRSSDKAYRLALNTYGKIGSKLVEIPDYKTHDQITADTQVGTQAGFESMGTGWKNAGVYPWENPTYVGGIDNVKILMALRIYGGKAHVYSGLAMFNPYARDQVRQYAKSESELFKLMIREMETDFRERINEAGKFVFGNNDSPILLDDGVMGEFSLGNETKRKPNSHLSLLAMVDAWHQLGINPYKHMICQTPLFRLMLGIAEYLFRTPELLEESVATALFDKGIRGDDLGFHTAVQEWATIIRNGDIAGYKQQFDATKEFFKGRIAEGMKKSSELIERLAGSRNNP